MIFKLSSLRDDMSKSRYPYKLVHRFVKNDKLGSIFSYVFTFAGSKYIYSSPLRLEDNFTSDDEEVECDEVYEKVQQVTTWVTKDK